MGSGNKRPMWSTIILSIAALLVLNALVGSATSPVERALHITSVPKWWPFVLAGIAGLVLGAVWNRGKPGDPAKAGPGQRGAGTAAGGRGKADPPGMGRHAVPRRQRRERERARLRSERLAEAQKREQRDREDAERDEAARLAAEQAAAAPPPVRTPLQRLGDVLTLRAIPPRAQAADKDRQAGRK